MATAILGRDVAKKTESVRIDLEVLSDARIAASYCGKSVGEYISDVLRPVVAKDIDEGHARRQKAASKQPPKG